MKRRPIAILTALVAALAGIVVLRLSVGLVPSTPPPARDEGLLAGFTVTQAPDQFEQVLMIVEIPPLTWTPLYAPSGPVFNTVVDGEVSTRELSGVGEHHYASGSAFVQVSGDLIEVGNATDANARMIATALLPLDAPAGVNQQGFSSNGYLYFGPGYRGPDTVALPIGPTVVERASIIVDRPASAFQVVQRLMESNGEHGRVQAAVSVLVPQSARLLTMEPSTWTGAQLSVTIRALGAPDGDPF